ncbi:MAG: PilZ domain-containing protein [Desulfobacterales bacterium]|jgi:hypothetical protein
MKERRQHKRLTIPLPVRLNAMNGGGIMALDLEARDISYSGTFIPTLTSFPEGTRFILDFTIPSDNLKDFKDVDSLIGCAGRMVRSDPHGVAIQFDKECQIENLKDL